MYPIIFRELYEATDLIWWYSHVRHTTTEKYGHNGKGWYFRFDDDDKMLIMMIGDDYTILLE